MLLVLGWAGWRLVTDKTLWPFAKTPAYGIARNSTQLSTDGAAVNFRTAAQQAGAQEVPVRKVLGDVMTLWVDALVKGDFTEFHRNLSFPWRQKDDPASLKKAFEILTPYKESLTLFPNRGKLVLLESRPYTVSEPAAGANLIRDNIGPQSPWLVRGEWRVNKTALGFNLVLIYEEGQWRPSSLRVEIFT
ncbi:MAG: hypothetical protein LBT47_09590 [Deltaproteobacteria bacterium]|nr:hypothetical protein [Deltaproteobacteria bacterium]